MCSTDNGKMRVDNKEQNLSNYTKFRSQGRENQGEWAFSREASPISLEVRATDPTVAYSDQSLNSILEIGKPLRIFAKD